eukprot:4229566-Ditylum_brightwellii.AAC.1
MNLVLTLEADNICQLTWWVDAAFVVYHDMRSYTRDFPMAGKGPAFVASTQQKLNTHSYTEAKLVGVNNVMPHIL